MREHEIRSAVTKDDDPYLTAYDEQARLRIMRQRLMADGDVPVEYFQDWTTYAAERHKPDVDWRDCDSHLQALQARKGAAVLDKATIEVLRLDADERIGTWRKSRERAREVRELREAAGLPVSDDLRREADEPDQGAAVTECAAAMRQRSQSTFNRILSGQQ